MPGSSLFALIDDIASILDDVSAMTKVAAHKTAGVLGDDLALNAQQVSGVRAEREIPVVWAVAKGSLINKAILVPAALALSAFAPWAVMPLLMIGGLYLCYEGCEKLAHKFLHSKREDAAHHQEHAQALADPKIDIVKVEKDKIRGAIRTDFVLSAEIIVISLGTVAEKEFMVQVGVLVGISILMTVGVYGLVAGIVKLDDAGIHLAAREGASALRTAQRAIGRAILRAAPWFLKSLSVVGTAAMFLVGGGIIVHGIPPVADRIHDMVHAIEELPTVGAVLALLAEWATSAAIGVACGAVLVAISVPILRYAKSRRKPKKADPAG